MRELPILFKTEMVQAIIAGTKNQTRRTAGLGKVNEDPDRYRFDGANEQGELAFEIIELDGRYSEIYRPVKSRYQKGDHIWVKETFCEPVLFDGVEKDYYYKANYPNGIDCDIDSKHVSGKWKSSLFMPKVAARIWLECTGVRCERLRDITEQDAIGEGIFKWTAVRTNWLRYKDYRHNLNWWLSPKRSYMSLWESINGVESWKSNPWVFIYDFKRIER